MRLKQPKGYRRLRRNEKIKVGDYFTSLENFDSKGNNPPPPIRGGYFRTNHGSYHLTHPVHDVFYYCRKVSQ